MFSEMIAELHNKGMPAPSALLKRYDFAVTKKMGIIKLPPAFWMKDPKINPRSDHLFWAALLLKDRPRIDMALSILAAEQMEKSSVGVHTHQQQISCTAKGLVKELLQQFADEETRRQFVRELQVLVPPDWLTPCETHNE